MTTRHFIILVNAFMTGACVMSFEMLGSRYLNPYFGSGIYTWAALISTVLIALMIGYFLGGWLADRYPKASVLGLMMLVSAIFMGTIPMMAPPIFDLIFDALESVAVGSLFAASFLIIPPLILLGGYSPFAIRLVLTDTTHSGRTSGLIYGINTFGSVVGTLFTTFVLVPSLGTLAITYLIAGTVVLFGCLFFIPGFWRYCKGFVLNQDQEKALDWLLWAILIQFGLGVLTLLMVVPVWLGVLHQAGAVALLLMAVYNSFLLNNVESSLVTGIQNDKVE